MKSGTVRQSAFARIAGLVAAVLLSALPGVGQELGGAGTIQGTVKDPTGGAMVAVAVEAEQPRHRAETNHDHRREWAGSSFSNLPPNPYHLAVSAQGFARYDRDVDVRSGVPIDLEVPLALAGADRLRRASSATRRTCSSATRPRTPTSTRA